MSTLTLPNLNLTAPDTRPRVFEATPWVTALLLFGVFMMADWSWDASQWYNSSETEVGALVDRISEGQAQRQIALALMFAYGVGLLLVPSARRVRMKLSVFYPIVVFCTWAFISVLWSTDKSLTLKRLVVLAAAVTTVAGMIKHFDWKQIALIALIGSGLTIGIAWANDMRVVAVNHVPLGLWRLGGVLHPNHTALHAGVGMLASLYLYKLTNRRWLLLFFAGMLIALMATKSRTALMAIMTGVAVFWLLSSSRSKMGWALIGAVWLGAAALWLSSMGDSMNLSGLAQMGRDDVKHQDVTQLTGRTDIWKFALMQAGKDPNRQWTGYGFESFWTPDNARGVSDFVNFRISEGHNIYLDWFLELGFVGAGLWVLIVLTGIVRWSRTAWKLRSATAAVGAAILAGTVVHGFAESSLGDVSLPTIFVYVAIAGSAVRRPDEELE